MKPNKIGIKWKIFGYMTVFSVFILGLLWVFQILLLTPFYRYIKIEQTKAYARTVTDHIDDGGLRELLRELTHQNSMCIRVVDRSGNTVIDDDAMPFCYIHNCSEELLTRYYREAQSKNGTIVRYFDPVEDLSRRVWNEEEHFVNPEDPALQSFASESQTGAPEEEPAGEGAQGRFGGKTPPKNKGIGESIIYGELVKNKEGEQLLVLVNAVIAPVNTTVETLRVQLACITVIFLLVSAAVALILSRNISRPIIRINQSAGELARGNYDTVFEAGGYREVSELSDTLAFAAKELSKAENLRRELIANISHDLRTPLTMITGYSEVMRDIPGENTPENMQIIIDEANRLSALVTDILDLSQLQAGAQSLTPALFNLTDCIRRILARYQKLKEQDGYRISLEASGDVWVTADEVKITQVVYNLINNAVNYTGEDKKVTVRQSLSPGKDQVRVEVEDTGEGIAEDQLDAIWDRYYKVDKTHKRAAIGTGLGLSIVKGVLELHGARYGASSTEGEGSVFWFELAVSDPGRREEGRALSE